VRPEIVTLRPHEHIFRWTGVAQEVPQHGHSGGPILWKGRVIGIFAGGRVNSLLCQLFAGEYRTSVGIVSIRAMLAEARQQGFTLESAASTSAGLAAAPK
jgi:hypothetical protein